MNITQKIIARHLRAGKMKFGTPISIQVDQTLFQDALGTMACLQFQAMGFSSSKTEMSVVYVDHNMLQTGFENAEDQLFLRTFCNKHGILFSPAGNGICHQVHLERFGQPGKTLLGTDSHTPTSGGLGMLAIGAGGLDVAATTGTGCYSLTMPKVIKVNLTGRLKNNCSAKDIILEILRRMTVKGGMGAVMEYGGDGVKTLSVYERATITNMGAELGATSSIFPSDKRTLEFLTAQHRAECYIPVFADEDAEYDDVLEIDLSQLEPLIALPHSPDNVRPVSSLSGVKVDQVCIGSCTNSSFADMMRVAQALRGKYIHPDVSLTVSPGSRQVLKLLAKNGALADMIASGARILESACGPCIGMGQAPRHNAVSLRTFNRNFEKRSGTEDAQVYLVSPETAVMSALSGYITAADESDFSDISLPASLEPDDSGFVYPDLTNGFLQEVFMGANIKPFPIFEKLESSLGGKALIKVGDHITTDHIMPGGAAAVPFRSNIPYLANMCLIRCDERFPALARQYGGGFIIAGENYGQGSSREHAALAPVQLGIRAVIAKDFSRIHRSNLINCGILPLTFADIQDYNNIAVLDDLLIPNLVKDLISRGKILLKNQTQSIDIPLQCQVSEEELQILLAGGIVNKIKMGNPQTTMEHSC